MAAVDSWTAAEVAYVIDRQASQRRLTEGAVKDGWILARKVALTPMLPVTGPLLIETQEGEYELPEGWEGFVAVDQAGYPYPIAKDEYEKTYEAVDPSES